jgi:hypothetical protein
MKNGCCRSNIPGECQFAAPRRLYAGCRQVAAIVAFTVRQMAHTMHGPGRCPGIAQQRFAGLETGYRFSRATGRPHQSGPRGSARGVARKPRTIHSMTRIRLVCADVALPALRARNRQSVARWFLTPNLDLPASRCLAALNTRTNYGTHNTLRYNAESTSGRNNRNGEARPKSWRVELVQSPAHTAHLKDVEPPTLPPPPMRQLPAQRLELSSLEHFSWLQPPERLINNATRMTGRAPCQEFYRSPDPESEIPRRAARVISS